MDVAGISLTRAQAWAAAAAVVVGVVWLRVRQMYEEVADQGGFLLIGNVAAKAAAETRLDASYEKANWANRLRVPDVLRYHPQVMAFMRLIREGESSQGKEAYFTVYGAKQVPDLIGNPHQCKRWVPTKNSSACGAYQFVCSTWKDMFDGENQVMSPLNQERACLRVIAWTGALPHVIRGDLKTAYRRLAVDSDSWTSLPGGKENKLPATRFREVFLKYGGKPAEGQ